MAQGRAMRVPKGEGLLVGTSHLRGFPGGAGSKASGLRAHGGPGVGSGWLGGTQGLWQELLWGAWLGPADPPGLRGEQRAAKVLKLAAQRLHRP